jgi:hypothetical protein
MGDWLSPYIVSNVLGVPVKYEHQAVNARLVALGSIAKFAKDTDTVWGAGISSLSTKLSAGADYLAIRGPHTADAVSKSGGRAPSLFGDPAIIMPKIFAPKVDREKGRYALVRHFVHRSLDLRLSDSVLELDILMSSPEDIENFIRQLLRCQAVVTSSLHVLILCVSYGIPCRLIDLDSFGAHVHGDGVKYRDFYDGVALTWRPPAVLHGPLTPSFIDSVVYDDRIRTGGAVDLIRSLKNWHSRIVSQ